MDHDQNCVKAYRPFSRDVIERTAAILEALEGGEEQ